MAAGTHSPVQRGRRCCGWQACEEAKYRVTRFIRRSWGVPHRGWSRSRHRLLEALCKQRAGSTQALTKSFGADATDDGGFGGCELFDTDEQQYFAKC